MWVNLDSGKMDQISVKLKDYGVLNMIRAKQIFEKIQYILMNEKKWANYGHKFLIGLKTI